VGGDEVRRCDGVRSGVFGRPRFGGVIVLALLVMLAGAYVGAFAASRVGLEYAPGVPSGPEAEQLSATAFPGLQVWGGGEAEAIEAFGDGEGVRYGAVSYWVKHTDATQDVAAYTAGARDRLAAAGWQIRDFQAAAPEPLVDGGAAYEASFWATRAGLVLSFSDHYWTGRPAYDSTGAAAFELWRTPPPWLTSVAWGGAIAGALLGLLLTVWVSRRTARVRSAGGPLAAATVAALILLLPSLLAPGEEQPMDSPWWGGFYHLGRGPAILSAAITILILLYAAAQYPASRAALGFLAGQVRRRPKVAAAVLALALFAAVLPATMRQLGVGYPQCRPTGIPAEPAAAGTSKHVQIFVSNTATAEQRGLIDAAIFRSRAGSLGELVWRPDSAGFRDTYCAGGRVPASAVATLPYYFDMDLSNTATFPALLAEVNGLAGVLAVQRARSADE
jgi:hypothetical protein